jgi:putative transposase
MTKSRFSQEKMVKILREAERTLVRQVVRKYGVSEQTIYAWREQFGGLEAVDVKKLRQLEQENAKIKKLLAERDLEIDVMKEVASKNGERARTTRASRVCTGTPELAASHVRATWHCSVDDRVRVATGQAGYSCARSDARARRPVPTVRVPSHPSLHGAAEAPHERRLCASALKDGRAPGAAQAAQEAGCNRAASPVSGA